MSNNKHFRFVAYVTYTIEQKPEEMPARAHFAIATSFKKKLTGDVQVRCKPGQTDAEIIAKAKELYRNSASFNLRPYPDRIKSERWQITAKVPY